MIKWNFAIFSIKIDCLLHLIFLWLRGKKRSLKPPLKVVADFTRWMQLFQLQSQIMWLWGDQIKQLFCIWLDMKRPDFYQILHFPPNTLLKSDVTRHDHVVHCRGSQECWFTLCQFHCQFHSRRHSLRITLKSTTVVYMRSRYAWTRKSWQRSEWHLDFNSVIKPSWRLAKSAECMDVNSLKNPRTFIDIDNDVNQACPSGNCSFTLPAI